MKYLPNTSIRTLDTGLHLASLLILRNVFTLVPDVCLLMVCYTKTWLPDSDWRIKANKAFHSMLILIPVYIIFGKGIAIAWFAHLLIDKYTH